MHLRELGRGWLRWLRWLRGASASPEDWGRAFGRLRWLSMRFRWAFPELSEALDRLANEMDDVVWEQTERLHQKNQSLELLYEIVATMHAPGAA